MYGVASLEAECLALYFPFIFLAPFRFGHDFLSFRSDAPTGIYSDVM